MATLDNSPSLFLGQSWETWANAVEVDGVDENDGIEQDDNGKEGLDSMRLRKEDMVLYGQCPARDEFYLVVCEHCGQVIKPQALQRHIKHRHGHISVNENIPVRPNRHREGTPPKLHAASGISQKADMHGKSPHESAREKTLTKSSSSSSLSKQEKANAAQQKRNHTNPIVVMSRLQLSRNAQRNNGHSSAAGGVIPDDEMHELIEGGEDHASGSMNNEIEPFCDVMAVISANSNNNSALTSVKTKDESFSESFSSDRKGSEFLKRLDRQDTLILRPSPQQGSSTSGGSPLMDSSVISSPCPISKSNAAKSSLSELGSWMGSSSPNTNRNNSPLASLEATQLSSQKSKDSPSHRASGSAPCTPVADSKSGDGGPMSAEPQSPTSVASSTTTISPQGVIVTNTTLTKYRKMQKEKNVPCKDRVFDPDKHCGVWIPETQKPCTRSLTCKTHALSLRRSVKGRSKSFDHLLKEHRAAKEIMLKEKADKLVHPALNKSSSGTILSSTSSSAALAGINGSMNSSQELSPMVTSPVNSKSGGHQNRIIPVSPAQRIQPRPALQKLLPSPHTRPTTLPIFPKDDAIQLTESGSRLSSDGEDDDDDSFDDKSITYLPYHPRPAAVNSFGGWLHGQGCYVFNRKEDLYRSAFMATVERHLHPPPHKKLCVESKLPKGSTHATNTKDPYEFTLASELHAAHSNAAAAANTSIAASMLVNKPKVKTTPTTTAAAVVPVARPQKPKESVRVRAPVTTNAVLGKVASSATPVGPAAKRKRSGSSPGPGGVGNVGLPGVSQLVTNNSTNPISIAIPSSCISLNLSSATLNNINATVTTNKGTTQLGAGKSNLLKDLSIVVTNSTASILNGHFVSIAGSNNVTHIHLNSLKDSNKCSKVKGSKSISGKPATTKTFFASSADGMPSNINAVMTAIPVTPESAIQSSVFNPASAAGVSCGLSTVSNGSSTTMTSPHPSPAPSPGGGIFTDSISQLVPATSPMPNGLSTTHTVKGFANISHLPAALAGSLAGIPSPTDGISPHLGTTFTLQSGKPAVPGRGIGKSGSKSATTIHAATAQQLAAAALSFNSQQGTKLLTTNTLNQVYSAPVITTGGPFTNIHRQPKMPAKAALGSQAKNVALQPMSLTFVAPTSVPSSTTPQQTHLVLQKNDSSPSNVLS